MVPVTSEGIINRYTGSDKTKAKSGDSPDQSTAGLMRFELQYCRVESTIRCMPVSKPQVRDRSEYTRVHVIGVFYLARDKNNIKQGNRRIKIIVYVKTA